MRQEGLFKDYASFVSNPDDTSLYENTFQANSALEMVTNCRYNEANGTIEFVTNHFSMFASSIFKGTIVKSF